MSLRKAINAKCRECIVDSTDKGSPSQQIAACICLDCPLHPVRPITCKSLPTDLLDYWRIRPDLLDDRARALIASQKLDLAICEEKQSELVPRIE